MKHFIKNYLRLFKLMIKLSPQMVPLYIVYILSVFSSSILEVYIIRELFQFTVGHAHLILFLSCVTSIVLLRFVQKYCEISLEKFNYANGLELKKYAYELQQEITYNALQTQDIQNKIEMTKRLFDDDIFGLIIRNILVQLNQLVKIGTYSLVLLFIAPYVLILFFLFSIMQWLMYRQNVANQIIKLEKEREIFRKEHYFEHVVQETSYAQDIRMHDMKSRMITEGQKANKEMLDMTMEYFVYNQLKVNRSMYIVECAQFVLALALSYYLFDQQQITFSIFVILMKTNFDLIFTLRNAIKTMFTTVLYNQMLSDYFSSITIFEQLLSNRKQPMTDPVEIIKVDNISVTINEKTILSSITATFHKGKKYAIVGRNGSGKTTLLQTLLGFQTLNSGAIYYNHTDISQAQMLDRVSVLFQKFHYYHIGLKNNVVSEYPFDAKRYHKILEQFQVTTINEDQMEASLGQKQRASIARTIYKDADVVILDELNSALDPIVEHDIFKNVFQEADQKIVIVVAHKLKHIISCDEILFMEDGQLIAQGTHQELYEKTGAYRTLYNSQM